MPTIKFVRCEKIIILLFYIRPIGGGAVISPPRIAPVCSGDTLNLTCTTTGRFLEWSFTLIPENETTPMRYTRSLQTYGPKHLQIFEQVIASTMFIYSRNSAENSLPLMSTLSVSPVSDGLNGTVVNCTDVTTSDTVSTIIIIVVLNEELILPRDMSLDLYLEKVNITVERFESSGVTVTLHWWLTVEHYYYQSYDINVVPQSFEQSILNFKERMHIHVQLKVLYNTSYNVTLIAIPFCGQNNVTSSVQELYFNPTTCQDSQNHNDSNTAMGQYQNSASTLGCPAPEDLPTLKATCNGNQSYSNEMCIDTEVMMKLNSVSIGAILGGVFAITVLLLGSTTCVIIVIVKLVVKKGSTKPGSLRRDLSCTHDYTCDGGVQLCSTDTIQKNCKNDTRGLVYADIGNTLFNQHPHQHSIASLDLADDRSVEYAQLNHNLLGYKLSTSQKVLQHNDNNQAVEGDETETDSVCVDLDNLLFQLRSQVTSKWYQFGCAVGIESKILDTFAEQCTPEDCIMEMLDYWLRNSKEKPTWRDVAKALKAIEVPQLAFGIEHVYTTGKLPVEIDNNSAPQVQGSFDTVSVVNEELPPPVPPKDVEWKPESGTPFARSGDDDKHFQTMEPAAPALPPKPINKNIKSHSGPFDFNQFGHELL